jgi:drug/metabolite transporter (DMT)-like permease
MDAPSGLISGLVAAMAWGSLDVLVAFAGRRVGGIASAAFVVGASCLILVPAAIAGGASFPTDPRHIALAIGSGAILAVGFVCFYTALRLGPISIVSPIAGLYGGLGALIAVVVLGESLVPMQFAGIAASTVGIFLAGLTLTPGAGLPRFTGRGVPLALVSLVSWSVGIVLLSILVRETDWLTALVAQRVPNALLLLLLLAALRLRGTPVTGTPPLAPEPEPVIDVTHAVDAGGSARRVSAALSRRPYVTLSAAAVLDVIGLGAFALGLQVAAAWLVTLVSSLGPMVTVAAGVVLLGERPRAVQWAGIGLVFAGIALVAIG